MNLENESDELASHRYSTKALQNLDSDQAERSFTDRSRMRACSNTAQRTRRTRRTHAPANFWEQLTATMVLILIAAAVVAGLLGDTKNTIAITRHRRCSMPFLASSRNIAPRKPSPRSRNCPCPNVRVLRDGKLQELPPRATWCQATSSNWKQATSSPRMCVCWKRSTFASRKPR